MSVRNTDGMLSFLSNERMWSRRWWADVQIETRPNEHSRMLDIWFRWIDGTSEMTSIDASRLLAASDYEMVILETIEKVAGLPR